MSYTGKWLKIDLSTGKFEVGETDRVLLEKYIGGKGLGFALLNKMAPNPEPLSEENILIFVNGPFTGTKVQTSGRTCLVTRSPLTGSAHDSHCGGNFGPALKRAGYDHVIIAGKSEKPAYIYLTDEKVEINDASNLWGKGIFETNDKLISRHGGTNPRVACIGPAGENLSKMACIGVDKHRQYGRGGVGAVMGSKNLKAIVGDGNTKIKYYDEAKFKRLNKEVTKRILTNPGVKLRRKKGTMKCVRCGQENEILPVKNFQKVTYEKFENLSSETTREELNWEDTSCFNCAIRCSKWAKWDKHQLEGPEFETTAFLGLGCKIDNIKDVAWSNEICNNLGLDTISAGSTCGFAMECYEKGLIEDWGGLELNWGDATAQRELLKLMAYRKGIGELFADGTRDAAQKIGKDSKDFAINVYGMEISGINPKGALTFGVAMSIADFASHTRLWIAEAEMGPSFTMDDIITVVAEGIDLMNVRNSLIICHFMPESLNRLAHVLNAATGVNHTTKSLMEAGARITNLARKYNLRNGRNHKDDILPERFFKEKSLSGFMRGKKIDKKFFKGLIQDYYKYRGWSEKGELV